MVHRPLHWRASACSQRSADSEEANHHFGERLTVALIFGRTTRKPARESEPRSEYNNALATEPR